METIELSMLNPGEEGGRREGGRREGGREGEA